MLGPSYSGRRILDEILARLSAIRPGEPQSYLGYKQMHDALGLTKLPNVTYGDSLKMQGLSDLAQWTKDNQLPAITGMIVDQQDFRPGKGYFTLFGRDEGDEQWWGHEVERSVRFDWTALLGSGNRGAELAPCPFDIGSVDRVRMTSTTVYRVLRDTAVAAWVKTLYQHRCQLCGHTIMLPNGRPYAEAHHVQPLGSPHNGRDIVENILCLCPNHHTEFDYGVRKLRLEDLRWVEGHRIGEQFVTYHNERFFNESRLAQIRSSDL